MADKSFQKDYPWHAALIGSNKDQVSSKNASNYDSKKVDQNGLTAIHLVVLQMIAHPPQTIGKHLYSNIVLALKSGVDPNAQCNLGFTALSMASLAQIRSFSDISSLSHATKTLQPEICEPQYEVLREISQILCQNGAKLDVNKHKFSPLSYTQLYYHERPLAQQYMLNFPLDISVRELFKLALLKAVTPERNSKLVYLSMVKHGVPFLHEPFTQLSLFSVLSILVEMTTYFGFEEFEHPYNLPSYHCKNPVTSYDLEIVSTVGYFIKTTYKGEWLKMANSDKHYHRIVFSKSEKMFLIMATYVAIMGSQMAGDDSQFDLVQSLAGYLGTVTVLHKVIASRNKWTEFTPDAKGAEYISRYLTEINGELWKKLVNLLSHQVNNRCYGSGLTALHYAAEYQDFEMIEFLVEKLGAYPYAVCLEGRFFYDLTYHPHDASKRTDQEEYFFQYEESLKKQVRSLMTQSARVIVKNKINFECLAQDRKLIKFINLHRPRPKPE